MRFFARGNIRQNKLFIMNFPRSKGQPSTGASGMSLKYKHANIPDFQERFSNYVKKRSNVAKYFYLLSRHICTFKMYFVDPGGPVVIILVTGFNVLGFKPGRGRWIFSEILL